MILLFSLLAFGGPPPKFPPKAEKEEWQCLSSVPIVRGVVMPKSITSMSCGDVAASCSGVLIPTSKVADLLKMKAYAEMCYALYEADTTALEEQIQIYKDRSTPPFIESTDEAKKTSQRWVGRIEGIAAAFIVIAALAQFLEYKN